MQSLESQCRELSRFVLSTKTVEELSHVLRAVLTPAEIESIAQRLAILDGISTGVAQREIAETLRVGIATVTRGSRVWQENRDCLGKYFPRVKETPAAGASGASGASGVGTGEDGGAGFGAQGTQGTSVSGEGGPAGKGGAGASSASGHGGTDVAAAAAAVSNNVTPKGVLGSFIPSPLS